MGDRFRLACAALAFGSLLAAPMVARADEGASPVGEWRTIDDKTGEAKALVKIYARGDELYGLVEKALSKSPGPPNCDACTDDRKGKPIVGMDIIRGVKNSGGAWSGGTIVDPESGKVYSCSLTVIDGGKRLSVRGYIGVSMFGRSQTWVKAN